MAPPSERKLQEQLMTDPEGRARRMFSEAVKSFEVKLSVCRSDEGKTGTGRVWVKERRHLTAYKADS